MLFFGLIERFIKFSYMGATVVGIFTLCVCMVDDQPKPGTSSGRCPLKHLQIAVRISKSHNRAPSNYPVNSYRLTRPIVEKFDFRLFDQHGLTVTGFKFYFAGAADHLLG